MFDKLIRIVQTGQNIEEQDMTWTWLFHFIGHLHGKNAHHQQIKTLQFITEILTQELHDPPALSPGSCPPGTPWPVAPLHTPSARDCPPCSYDDEPHLCTPHSSDSPRHTRYSLVRYIGGPCSHLKCIVKIKLYSSALIVFLGLASWIDIFFTADIDLPAKGWKTMTYAWCLFWAERDLYRDSSALKRYLSLQSHQKNCPHFSRFIRARRGTNSLLFSFRRKET